MARNKTKGTPKRSPNGKTSRGISKPKGTPKRSPNGKTSRANK